MSENKSKKSLLAELKKLRQRVADLEAGEIKRIQAEEALRQSEEYSSTILNHSPYPILVINPDGSIRYVNPALEQLTGFSLFELVGRKTPYPWWTEETLGKTGRDSDTAFRHGARAKEELFKRKSGERFWVEITMTPIMTNGEFKYYLASWVDITERRQAEEELKRNKEYLESLNDSLSEAILTVDIPDNIDDRTFKYANKAVENIFGYEQKELLDKGPLVQYASKEDFFKASQFLKSAISQGTKVIHRELLLKRKNGDTFPAELTTTFLRTGGKVRQIISIIRDITERRRAEEALHLRAHLLNEATDSIIATDLDGNLLYMNEATCRTRGYSKEEMLNMNVKQLVPPEMAGAVEERLRRVKKEGTIVIESEHVRKDGSVFPVESTARTINLEDRTIVLFVIRDITERKQAEEALRESEEHYRALLELGERTGEAVVMLQDDERGRGMHVYASDEWALITGYSRDELLNMSLLDLVHPDAREEARKRHERRMHGEVLPGLYEVTIIRKDGSGVPVEGTYAYSSYKGKPANVGYIRNISERKKMEEQLVVTDRLASIGELASGVAHELNNPLTGIIGFSELLLKKNIAEEIKEDLEIINREAQRTAQIVRNLLTFARRHETTKEPVDINQAIKSVLDLRAYEQKVHNIEVVANFDPNLPKTTADLFRLQQVFINIIINAEHFMTEAHGRGTLTITTESDGDVIRASFADDGPGIREENMRHLFDPFFTTKEVGKGTGLGLSICHGIVTEHGGQIYTESELKKGATFTLELPVK